MVSIDFPLELLHCVVHNMSNEDEPQANSTGRGEKTVREYLEEHFNDEAVKDENATLLLVIKALSQVFSPPFFHNKKRLKWVLVVIINKLQVVQSGAQNIEVAVMTKSPHQVSSKTQLIGSFWDETFLFVSWMQKTLNTEIF